MEKTLEQQVAELTAQISELTATNSGLTSQLQTSQGELRTVRHKAVFKDLANELGVRPKAVESLYRLSGYDPGEADEADPAAVRAVIEGAREEHDYCFTPAEVVTPATPAGKTPATLPAAPAKPTGLGSGRGKTPPAPEKFRVTLANTRDFAWLQKNKAAYAAAAANDTLEVIDE